MPPLRASRRYGRQWGSDFTREPLDVFAKKERERTAQILRAASFQKYGTDQMPSPRQLASEDPFQRAAETVREKPTQAPPKRKGGGGGLLGKIGDIAGDIRQQAMAYTEAYNRGVRKQIDRLPVGLAEAARLLTGQPAPGQERSPMSILSGERYFRESGIDISGLPKIARQAIDVIGSPAGLAPVGTAARGVVGTRPVIGSLMRRAGLETASGVVGLRAGEQVMQALPEETPTPLRIAAGIGTGVLAGGATFSALNNPRRFNQRLNEGLARLQGRPGREPILGLQTEKIDLPEKQPGFVVKRLDEFEEWPDLFQARNADPGKSYSESRVQELEKKFDPNMLDPGGLVYDVSTGKYVLFSGHHRTEVIRRMAERGVMKPEAVWKVYHGDLTNPAHVAELQRLADYENYGVATTTLVENVRVYRRAKNRGESEDEIFNHLRSVDRLERQYLDAISDLPDDIIERWAEAKGNVANLGIIAKAFRTYKLNQNELRAIVGRYGPGGSQQGISPTALDSRLKEAGRAITEARGGAPELPGMEDTVSRILAAVDDIDAADRELKSMLAKLRQADRVLEELGDDAEVATLRARLKERVDALTEQRKRAIADFQARKRARWEQSAEPGGGPGSNVHPGDRPGDAGAGGTAPRAPGTITGSPRTGEWIQYQGQPAEVVAAEPGQIRLRLPDASEINVPTGRDMFGQEAMFTLIERPVEQSALGLEGGSRGMVVPSNQKDFLGEVVPATSVPERPIPTRVQHYYEGRPSSPNRPQGLYTSPVGQEAFAPQFPSRTKVEFEVNPKAKILEIEANSEMAGLALARRIIPDYEDLARMDHASLLAEARRRFPDVNWSYYADPNRRLTILEALGGMEARRQGYDAVFARSSTPGADEFIALTDNAFQPKASSPPASGGRLPRPEGEPKTFPAPEGETKPIPGLRAVEPEGYVLNVPEGEPAQYRRTLTEAAIETQKVKPTPAPLTEKPRFDGTTEDIIDDWGGTVANYHPNLAQPHDTLGRDYKLLRRAARNGYRRAWLRERLDADGVEDIRELDPGEAAMLRKEASIAADTAIREVEDEVLREGFWDPIAAGSRGIGHPEGRPTGGVGGRVEEPTGTPPIPPPEPPQPGEPGLGNRQRAFGQEGEPRKDLLLGRERDDLIREVEQGRQSWRGRFGERYRGAKRRLGASQAEAVRREFARTDRLIVDTINDDVDRIMFDAMEAGLDPVQDAEGVWRLGQTPFEDVIERTTDEGRAAYQALTDKQKDIIERIRRLNDDWNKTIEAHGGEVPMREGLEQYFPRQVLGREVTGGFVPKTTGGATRRSRVLGMRRIGPRTQESVAAGVEEGIRYANPWDALKAGMMRKARMAQDQYIANLISPLAVKEGKSGFGFRPLSVDHPALNRLRVVGQADSGAVMLATERPVFPEKIADELDAILARPSILNSQPGRVVQTLNAIGIPLRASADISFLLNQGIGFMESSPANAQNAIRGSIKVIRSALGDPQQYAELRRAELRRTRDLLKKVGIEADDADRWLTQRGKHVASEGAQDEFLFPEIAQDVVRKIPKIGERAADTIQWSNETFARYLNYARDVLANDELERAVAQGLKGSDLDGHMRKALASVNRMTGWTGSQPTGIEQIALFAPRFFRSNLEQIVKAFVDGGVEGEIARRHLMRLAATAMVTAYAINAIRGYNTDIDPRSYNFMRIRNVFGRDVSLFGPFATIIRGAAQTLGGDPGEMSAGPRGRGFVFGTNRPSPGLENIPAFARTKASPVLATAWTLMSGRTFDERPVSRNPLSTEFFTRTIPGLLSENIPFSAQAGLEEGIVPAVRDRNPAALVRGIGATLASSTGVQSSAMTPAERRDLAREEVARRLFGRDYRSLSAIEKSEVNADPKVQSLQREATRRGLERDDRRIAAENEYRRGLEAAARDLAAGVDESGQRFTGVDYREAVQDLAFARYNQLKAIGEIDRQGLLGAYFALREEATMANGQTNYELLERLQAEFEAKHPEIEDQLDRFLGTRDDPTMRRLREARKQAREYFRIPAYAGMTVEEAERIQEILAITGDMVTNRQVPGYRAGLAALLERGLITEDEVRKAILAQRMGTNPERRAFALEHPEFAQFYRGFDESLGALGSFPLSIAGSAGRPPVQRAGRARGRRRRSFSERRSLARS